MQRTALEELSEDKSKERQLKLNAEFASSGFESKAIDAITARELVVIDESFRELMHGKSAKSSISNETECCICLESFTIAAGIKCHGTQNHFQCNNCFCSYVEMLNAQKFFNPHLLRSRDGILIFSLFVCFHRVYSILFMC